MPDVKTQCHSAAGHSSVVKVPAQTCQMLQTSFTELLLLRASKMSSIYLDKERQICDCPHPRYKIPGQGIIHVGVENVDGASCTNSVMRLNPQ